MLEQALVALAASGGTAVVTAAGTDAWNDVRQAVSRWFGRGDVRRERAELERLDQTATILEAADAAGAESARVRQEASWQARIEAALENLVGSERDQAAVQLRDLLARHAPQGAVSAGPGGIAVAGNMDIHAEKGSIAAGVIHGGARLTNPQVPDPSQG
jgi:hypothetical protein